MYLRFKKCLPNDLDELVQISKTTFVNAFETHNDPDDFKNYIDLAFKRDQLHAELKNPHSAFYFAYLDKNLVGYFKLNWNDAQSDLKRHDSLELERIYVLQEFQGKSIGEKMLEEVKRLGTKTNKNFLWLGVWEHNKGAIKFYEKNGFSKFGMHPYLIGKDKQMDWLMRFDLINFNED
jgi:diamine N-acetyltransferase